jgi:hypothetical protein
VGLDQDIAGCGAVSRAGWGSSPRVLVARSATNAEASRKIALAKQAALRP